MSSSPSSSSSKRKPPFLLLVLFLLLLRSSPTKLSRARSSGRRVSFFGDSLRSSQDEGDALPSAGETAVDRFDADRGAREGKILSLFSIVQFANLPCVSTSSFTKTTTGSTTRNGTCLTSVECSEQGGTAAGTCAASFGVCCVFTVSTSGNTISRNCTYLQNPSFPSVYSSTTSIQYTISKCSCDVCFLRLDFECFTTVASGLTTEVNGGQCTDQFTVTSNTGFAVPTICGQNTGQHIYVDMGTVCTDTVTLNFAFTGTSTVRTWELKASQIPCGSDFSPPDGCLQYHTELDGRISTFNFLATANDNHLASQRYSICIRQAEGFCCVQYQVCGDNLSMSLGLSNANIATMAFQDDSCSMDYVGIEGSSDTCNQSGVVGATTNRYCGMFLNTVQQGQNIAICDCTSPFEVNIVTDAVDDNKGASNTVSRSRGTCLEYTQIPCAN